MVLDDSHLALLDLWSRTEGERRVVRLRCHRDFDRNYCQINAVGICAGGYFCAAGGVGLFFRACWVW